MTSPADTPVRIAAEQRASRAPGTAGVPGADAGARAGADYRLTAPSARYRTGKFSPSSEQRQVIENQVRRVRVLAGPGTGKTATLVEAAVERITVRGVDPASILVLTFSRRAAKELSERLSSRLDLTLGEPMVRTLHSYAYSLLKADAARSGLPAPRMLGAAEADRMVADLLDGQLLDGAAQWPGSIRPALGSAAFASEVRDLVLRTGERALSPARIAAIGRARRRPEWVAAAGLAREYQQVLDLRMGTTGLGTALDQAELTVAALEVLGRDDVLAAEQTRVRRVFVDEYQDVDPGQAALIERVAAGADELVVVGDPDQAIYSFRGSEPAALRDVEVDRTVVLKTSHRSGAALLAATRRIATALPGPPRHRQLTAAVDPPPTVGAGEERAAVEIRTLPTAARQAAYVADRLRRAHLQDGIAWASMAVILRSPAASMPPLTRAFAAAGVPLVARGTGVPLDDPLAADLVTLLGTGPDRTTIDAEVVARLLGSAVLGPDTLDALAVRRLRGVARRVMSEHRGAGSAGGTGAVIAELVRALAGVVRDQEDSDPAADRVAAARAVLAAVPDPIAAAVRRLVRLIRTADAVADERDAEVALWQLWTTSGLEKDLLATVGRGGRAAARADASLDAVVSLFEDAADLAARLPGAGVTAFVEQARARRVPDEQTASGAAAHEAVSVLSAHGAKGLEWDLVCVVDVQDGRWPDLRTSAGLLRVDELLDLAAGVDPAVSRSAERLADERRLFYVACTRARRQLLVTAVDGDDSVPSRFLGELAGPEPVAAGWPGGVSPRRALHLVDLVGELRRVVCDEGTEPETALEAARQLARLAAAGVPGAHPDQWWGLAGPTTEEDAVPPGAPVRISPSAVESLQTCELRGVLERRGARGPMGDAQTLGVAVHAAVSGLARGVPRDVVVAEIDAHLAGQERLPDWQIRRLRRAIVSMTDAADRWLQVIGAGGWATIGSELAVDLPLASIDGHPIHLTGRVDLLSQTPEGTTVVTDFKTGSAKVTRAQAAEHLQLAAYQLAVAAGAVVSGRTVLPDGVVEPASAERPRVTVSGGAQLVYLRTGEAKVLTQEALDDDRARDVAEQAVVGAAALISSAVRASENPACERCPVRTCCPLQTEGRQVTR
ncbi:ATP-dependent DNA helicase [Nakamurella sp. A5-74]|uniref:DNA 3'-5' helicase n=1 Tax=Nakamurella sp. A5-74 TaxID=3158264 RepID=A0AAU8DKH9_9ACTN